MTALATFYLFLALLGGHLIGEFPLQPVAMLNGKSADRSPLHGIPWQFWMLGHCATHGVIVAHITHNPLLGLLETAAHFILDHAKCTNSQITYWQDQLLHVWCKIVWMAMILNWGI